MGLVCTHVHVLRRLPGRVRDFTLELVFVSVSVEDEMADVGDDLVLRRGIVETVRRITA